MSPKQWELLAYLEFLRMDKYKIKTGGERMATLTEENWKRDRLVWWFSDSLPDLWVTA